MAAAANVAGYVTSKSLKITVIFSFISLKVHRRPWLLSIRACRMHLPTNKGLKCKVCILPWLNLKILLSVKTISHFCQIYFVHIVIYVSVAITYPTVLFSRANICHITPSATSPTSADPSLCRSHHKSAKLICFSHSISLKSCRALCASWASSEALADALAFWAHILHVRVFTA